MNPKATKLSIALTLLNSFLIAVAGVLPTRAQEPTQRSAAGIDHEAHGASKVRNLRGGKSTVFRFENLRSGAIRTKNGWNVQDFAPSFFNPNSVQITVNMTLVSDDPKFVFSNGRIGTYTKTHVFRPMFGATDNIYIGSTAFGKQDWPVAQGTNFIGSVEFSSSEAFYLVMLGDPATGIGEDEDLTKAYFKAWGEKSISGDSPPSAKVTVAKDDNQKQLAVRRVKGAALSLGEAAWDNELNQFVVPYTNYWHNETSWPIGAHSVVTIENDRDEPVTYTLRHIPYYGAEFNPKNGKITRYQEQVIQLKLSPHETRKTPLEQLYGWDPDQMNALEGCLLIKTDQSDAQAHNTIQLSFAANDSGKPIHAVIP